MSGLLQIRNVPDDARRVLKERAAARGESLNTYLLSLIDREIARPTVAEVLERAASRNEPAAGSSVEHLRAERRERERWLLERHGS